MTAHLRVDDLPPGFIPTRHGAARGSVGSLLGLLRFVVRDAEPSPGRWRQIGEALLHGDPPMDRLLEWMLSVGLHTSRPLFEQALEHGIDAVADAPAPLRTFFALVDRRPDWVDMRLVEEGARVTARGGMDYFLVDRDLALMGGYQASAFNKALLLTGALTRGAVRRVAETAQWYLDCTASGGLERHGAGFRSTMRVRLIHALVRHHVQRMPEWRMRDWGLPVNQIDMAATALAFPLVMLLGGRAMGVLLTSRESQAAIHHGRYAAWLMGVEDRWLPASEADGCRLLYQLGLSIANPDESSVQLGQALMNEPLQRDYRRLPWLAARYQRARHLSVTSLFIGASGRRALGLPAFVVPWYPLLRLPWNLARHTLARVVPGGQERLGRAGRQAVVDFLHACTGDPRQRVGDAARHLAHPHT